MDESVIKARVIARQRAKELVDLIRSEAAEHIDEPSADAFWEVIRDACPLLPRKKSRADLGPMTDQEARQFGNQPMLFGKCVGKRLDEIELDYLDWLADQPFHKNLRRYLASRRIQAED